jgi:hypothetical protein
MFSVKTGLNQVEIVRRALDYYAEAEEMKEQRRYLSREQQANLREIARRKGVSEREVISDAVNREIKFMARLYEKRNNRKET